MAKLVRGSLKLKTKTSGSNVNVSVSANASVSKPTNTASLKNPVKLVTQKTPAQQAFEAAHQKKQQEKLPSLAAKSHKEKVAQFNDYLGKLSEHHDIPKVGPG